MVDTGDLKSPGTNPPVPVRVRPSAPASLEAGHLALSAVAALWIRDAVNAFGDVCRKDDRRKETSRNQYRHPTSDGESRTATVVDEAADDAVFLLGGAQFRFEVLD
jgi:hypothetical protein